MFLITFWSAHTNLVDVQLNSTLRLTSGTLKSTPLPWLPVLANIEPLALRRKATVDKFLTKTRNMGTTRRYHQPACTPSVIQTPTMDRHGTTGHHNSVARRLGVGSCGQPLFSMRPCYPTTRFRSPPTSVVSAKPLPHRPRPVQSLPQAVGAGHQ